VNGAKDKNLDPSVYGPALPQPNVWSDVVFLRWLGVSQAHSVNVNTLQHVFRINIANQDTYSVIKQALGSRNPTSWATRVTFTPAPFNVNVLTDDNVAYLGLLATPNVRGITWMLIQHKDNSQLGLKYIDSISVWGVAPTYNIYIHIAGWSPPF
jgi:hypothetical protein